MNDRLYRISHAQIPRLALNFSFVESGSDLWREQGVIQRSSGEWKSPLLLIQLLYNDTRTGEIVIRLFLGPGMLGGRGEAAWNGEELGKETEKDIYTLDQWQKCHNMERIHTQYLLDPILYAVQCSV